MIWIKDYSLYYLIFMSTQRRFQTHNNANELPSEDDRQVY